MGKGAGSEQRSQSLITIRQNGTVVESTEEELRALRLRNDVALLREALPSIPEPVARPVIFMMVGLPGSGKSYMRKLLLQMLTEESDGTVAVATIENDRLRRVIAKIMQTELPEGVHPGRPIYTPEENWRVFQACRQLGRELVQEGRCILLDATNLYEKSRKQVYDIAKETGTRLVVLEAVAPRDVVKERIDARVKKQMTDPDPDQFSEATFEIYDAMLKHREEISVPHHTIDTSTDYQDELRWLAIEIAAYARGA
jgi:predicted kinase